MSACTSSAGSPSGALPLTGSSRFGREPGTMLGRSYAVVRLDRVRPDPRYALRSGLGEDLGVLVASVRARGVMQPIVVERDGTSFVIREGHRRAAAAVLAGHKWIPALVLQHPVSERAWLLQLVGEAATVRVLGIDDLRHLVVRLRDLGCSWRRIALACGVSPRVVTSWVCDDENRQLRVGPPRRRATRRLIAAHRDEFARLLLEERQLRIGRWRHDNRHCDEDRPRHRHGCPADCREFGWWLSRGWCLLRRAPRRAAALLTGVGFAVWADVWWLLIVLVTVLVGFGVWARGWPLSFERRVTHPSWRRRTKRGVRRGWPGLMEACGLARRVLQHSGMAELRTPGLALVRWEEPDVLVTVPQLLVGQTIDDVAAASERLRTAVGSRQIRVVPNETDTACNVRFLFADPLGRVVEASLPPPTAVPNITWADMGITETGQRWLLPIQVHSLTGGATGAGKAAVMWMMNLNLAPAIKCGLVQVHGIDLKSGVEHAWVCRYLPATPPPLKQRSCSWRTVSRRCSCGPHRWPDTAGRIRRRWRSRW